MESQTLPKSAQTVQNHINKKGYDCTVIILNESARTAQDAANALGCTVSQIAKSLIFKIKETNEPLLILTSGSNRVNEKTVEAHLGQPIAKADAAFTREVTGFAIGGIPPTGHPHPIQTLIDKDLLQYTELWAAAGTPEAVFKLTPAELQSLTGGTIITVI